MQYPIIFFLFFLVSCGGGSGDLEVNSNNSDPISGYKYVPPSGTLTIIALHELQMLFGQKILITII